MFACNETLHDRPTQELWHEYIEHRYFTQPESEAARSPGVGAKTRSTRSTGQFLAFAI
jgi:hypothetical protein